ncbi:putative protein-like isoform X1 [Capsicum annuum]|nr:putative protein-like isoform X1 [Capsicum annuum]
MAGNWLPPAHLTGSGRPVFLPGEVECSLLSSVDLYSEETPNFPHLKSGLIILTTHRLIWVQESTPSPTAFFVPVSSITHIFSLKRSIKSMFASPRFRFQASLGEKGEKGLVVITLILRGKSDVDSFVEKFWEAWRNKGWLDGVKSGSGGEGEGSGSGGDGGFAVFTRIRSMVTTPDALRAGVTASDAAMTLGIAPAMAKEHLLSAEGKGLLCRDVSPDGFRFFVNLLQEIDADDIFLVKEYGIYHTWVKAVSVAREHESRHYMARQYMVDPEL